MYFTSLGEVVDTLFFSFVARQRRAFSRAASIFVIAHSFLSTKMPPTIIFDSAAVQFHMIYYCIGRWFVKAGRDESRD